jgi:hypothetical protein
MKNAATEYSLAELLDHPGLTWVMASGGIERRCLELMLDAPSRGRRHAEIETRTTIFDQRTSD